MKSILALTFYVLLALSSIAATSKNGEDIPVEYKACKLDSECIQVGNDCAGCCKYAAIQKTFKVAFDKRLKGICRSYQHGMCECCGPDFQVKCLDSKCSLVEVPGSRKAKCGQ